MQFLINTFPNMDFEPEKAGYTKMKEPSMEKLLLIAIPVGILVSLALYFLAQILTTTNLDMIRIQLGDFPIIIEILLFLGGFILFNVVIVVLHELVHAFCFPEGLASKHVGFGFHKSGAFFAFYTEDMSKVRMMITMLMPFILFTMMPLLTIIIIDKNLPLVMMALMYHALLASGDLVGLYLIIKNTPRHSVLKNKGYFTYYK